MYENTGEPLATGYALGRDANCGYGDGFGGGAWWIIVLIALMFGGNWGNRGFGGQELGYDIGKLATTNDVASGFATSNTLAGLNDIKLQLANGFAGVDRGVADLGYRLQNCCCETNRNIDSVKYENAKNTCDIITNQNANTQKIIDHLTQSEIDRLRTELQSAQFQLSQINQTSNIVNTLRPTPVPAYPSCSPYTAYSGFGGCGYNGTF